MPPCRSRRHISAWPQLQAAAGQWAVRRRARAPAARPRVDGPGALPLGACRSRHLRMVWSRHRPWRLQHAHRWRSSPPHRRDRPPSDAAVTAPSLTAVDARRHRAARVRRGRLRRRASQRPPPRRCGAEGGALEHDSDRSVSGRQHQRYPGAFTILHPPTTTVRATNRNTRAQQGPTATELHRARVVSRPAAQRCSAVRCSDGCP